jgi:phenylalanyl-tRNA synthetase beta subunit
MLELSALIAEMCPEAIFEDVVDIYPVKQKENKLSFSISKISKILGIEIMPDIVSDVLKRYEISFTENNGVFEIVVPPLRFDLNIEEDMAEEIGRIMGYDKVSPHIPKIDFIPKENDTFTQMSFVREKLLNDGYSEVMNYTFRDRGEVSVLASASDKKFLRTNLSDGLQESIKLNNSNLPLLGIKEVKVFEIGKVFTKNGEELHVAYGNKKEIKEMKLSETVLSFSSSDDAKQDIREKKSKTVERNHSFNMWSLFPFIARDISLWVPEGVESDTVMKIVRENMGDMVVRGPEIFDEFKKDGKKSYAFRLVFQSYDRTLTDQEVNSVMEKINNKLKENKDWLVR